MSLLPWMDNTYWYHPLRQLDRQLNFYQDPETWFSRNFFPLEDMRKLKLALHDTGVSISSDKEKFQANVDVQQFKPDEITVKVTGDNSITIEGKHEEKEDEHGFISRHFVRRYVLPENCDVRQVQSKLSSDGVLTITAPKIIPGEQIEHREIPILRTRQPVKTIEQKGGAECEK